MFASSPRGISNLFLVYGSSILCFLFFSLLLASVGFFFRIPILSCYFFLTLPCTLVFVILSCSIFPYRGKLFDTLIVMAFFLSSFYLSLEISRSFFDISYDGQAYHQEALIQLSQGWNPFFQPLSSWQSNNMHRWLSHYSKGVWIYETMIFKITQDMEAAKLFHLWLMLAAFFMTLSFFSSFGFLPFFLSFLVSLLAAFNPVAMYQSLSFYLDGQLMSLMVIFIVILGFHYQKSHPYYCLLLFLVISILVNVKLTAPMYTAIILLAYLLLLWMKNRIRQLSQVFKVATAALLVGLLLFGFSPYVTNALGQGNPFYPALGTDRSDYTLPQFPSNFIGKNSGFLLFYSIFSKSDNVRGPDKKAYLKIPFTVSQEELRAFTDTNAKQGGFGPLFGGAILLSLLVILAASRNLYVSARRLSRRNTPGVTGSSSEGGKPYSNYFLGFFCMGVVLLTCLINPASSLARFIPQMWLFPLFAFMLAYNLNSYFLRIAGHLILLTLLINNFLIGFTYYHYNWEITGVYHQRLEAMAAASEKKPLQLYFGHFRPGTLRFDRFKIHYEVVELKENCENGQRILPHSVILKCYPE